MILGGRGSGKTRAGAEWVRSQVEGARPTDPGKAQRIALLAATADQARDVMVLGPSGLLATTPPDRRPVFQVSRKRLLWPNGAEAQLFSAADPEALRGPQFDLAWCDELGKWPRAAAAWDMLQFGLRLGHAPRQVVTTTPRRSETLQRILADPAAVTTTARTEANAAALAPGFVERLRQRYGHGRLAREELDGMLDDAPDGALWTDAMLTAARAAPEPALERIVVAVDPPTTAHARSDACGIVAVGGSAATGRAAVLGDFSLTAASPQRWAEAAIGAYRALGADRLVAEVNQGGDMVEAVIRQIDPAIAFRAVRASRGKAIRAEPVAALYEIGRIAHRPGLDALEREMRRVIRDGSGGLRVEGEGRSGSPDRVDALVWALTDLFLDHGAPRVRAL